jgi:hypothetical protein
MNIKETIELIQKNELEQLQVLCSKFVTLNDLPIDIFIEKLNDARQNLINYPNIKVFEVEATISNKLYEGVDDYLNKRELIDALTFDGNLNPLLNIRKLELLENKKYYEEVFLPTAWLGRPFYNDNKEFKSYCFFGETYFNFAVTFELVKGTDEVVNMWYCKKFTCAELGVNDKHTYNFKVYVDEYQNFIKNEIYFELELKVKENEEIVEMYRTRILSYLNIQSLHFELQHKNYIKVSRDLYRIANNWSNLFLQIEDLLDYLPYSAECKIALDEYENIDDNENLTPCLWKLKHQDLIDKLFNFNLGILDDRSCKETEDYIFLDNDLNIKIEKKDFEIVKKFCDITWDLECG